MAPPQGPPSSESFRFHSSCCSSQAVVVGDALYLALNDQLWRSDGTDEGTTLVVDMAPGEGGFIGEGPVVVGDALYFTVDRARRGELWRSDGTPEGTVRLLALARD